MTFTAITARHDAVYSSSSQRRITAYRIERKDGEILRLTTYDQPLWIGSEEFVPSGETTATGGVSAMATRRESSLSEHNSGVEGIISSDTISTADLRAGLYHGATVTVHMLDGAYPWAGRITKVYEVADVVFDTDGRWRFDLVSTIAARLRTKKGEVISRTDRNRIFDVRSTRYQRHWAGVSGSCDFSVTGGRFVTLAAGGLSDVFAVGDRLKVDQVGANDDYEAPIIGVTDTQLTLDGYAESFVLSAQTGVTSDLNRVPERLVESEWVVGHAAGNYAKVSQVINTYTFRASIPRATISAITAQSSGQTLVDTVSNHYLCGATPTPGHYIRIPFGIRGNVGHVSGINGSYTTGQVLSGTRIRVFVDTTSAGATLGFVSFEPPAGWFDYGSITWKDGDNAGTVQDIRESTAFVEDTSGGFAGYVQITLDSEPAQPIKVGDDLSMVTGYDGTPEQCYDKFGNIVNFNGEPTVPSADVLLKTPSAS